MKNKYDHKTSQFGINPEGLHLLRNNFNFESISFGEIQRATIERGKDFKNWKIMLLIGLLSFGTALYLTAKIIYGLTEGVHGVIYIEAIVLPVLPGIAGVLLIFSSIRKAVVLRLTTNKKKHWLSLRALEKDGSLEEFEAYMQDHLPKLKIER